MISDFIFSVVEMVNYLILGVGFVGLIMVKMLFDCGIEDVVLFEVLDKVGGKCLLFEIGDYVVEFGICYVIWLYKYIFK